MRFMMTLVCILFLCGQADAGKKHRRITDDEWRDYYGLGPAARRDDPNVQWWLLERSRQGRSSGRWRHPRWEQENNAYEEWLKRGCTTKPRVTDDVIIPAGD